MRRHARDAVDLRAGARGSRARARVGRALTRSPRSARSRARGLGDRLGQRGRQHRGVEARRAQARASSTPLTASPAPVVSTGLRRHARHVARSARRRAAARRRRRASRRPRARPSASSASAAAAGSSARRSAARASARLHLTSERAGHAAAHGATAGVGRRQRCGAQVRGRSRPACRRRARWRRAVSASIRSCSPTSVFEVKNSASHASTASAGAPRACAGATPSP